MTTSFIVLGGAPAQEAEIAMAVRDEGTHAERVGQVSCSHQHLLVGGESSGLRPTLEHEVLQAEGQEA